MKTRTYLHSGVTPIEVLVGIVTLATLIAVVVPAIAGEQRTDLTMRCMANLKRIAKAAVEYAIDNGDWIVGSPAGSGRYLIGAPHAFGPAVQNWDFMGPIQHMWKKNDPLPELGDPDAVIERFNDLRSSDRFLCPANTFEAPHFAGPDAGTGPMISYNTIRLQMWVGGIGRPSSLFAPTNWNETLPDTWRPSVTDMGNPANKVFCADGARFSTTTIPPDYNLSLHAGFGGAFSDGAPFSVFSHSWDRSWANGQTTGIDARIYAYRHSTAAPPQGAGPNAFKMNLAFYDTHVETQGDLESTNPQQWLPQGTVVRSTRLWRDTVEAFDLPGIFRIGE